VPVVGSITENCPPGATIPEFHPLPSDVEVCAIESVFIHVTVSPAETVSSSGVKALLPRTSAPAGITTDDEGPADVGGGVGDGEVGDGAVDEESLLPHPIANIVMADTTERRNDNMRASKEEVVNTRCTIPTTRQSPRGLQAKHSRCLTNAPEDGETCKPPALSEHVNVSAACFQTVMDIRSTWLMHTMQATRRRGSDRLTSVGLTSDRDALAMPSRWLRIEEVTVRAGFGDSARYAESKDTTPAVSACRASRAF
jgi:hypothetical protein